jgi:hypothetical protein
VLDHGPLERDLRAGKFLQGLAIGGDRLLEPRRAPFPLAELRLPRAQSAIRTSNPPQNMRIPSKGSVLGFISAKRGSFMTAALTRSRCSRDS